MIKKEDLHISLHVLITSLFYPALLGSIFFYLLEDINSRNLNLTNIIYFIAALAIIVSFSVDFLYTYSVKTLYNWKLFIFDLIIIIALFFSYKTLLSSIINSSDVKTFYSYFVIIHLVFLVWDLIFIPKKNKSKKIIAFDICGLILTVLFYFFMYSRAWYGVLYLWIFTLLYLSIGLNEINRLITKAEKN